MTLYEFIDALNVAIKENGYDDQIKMLAYVEHNVDFMEDPPKTISIKHGRSLSLNGRTVARFYEGEEIEESVFEEILNKVKDILMEKYGTI